MNPQQDEVVDPKAARVLEMLERWNDRLDGRADHDRQHARQLMKSRIRIVLVGSGKEEGTTDPESLWVWTRNISQSGICFIHDGLLDTDQIIICLQPKEEKIYFRAQIVRRREVHEGFWEYGARLLSRADPEAS